MYAFIASLFGALRFPKEPAPNLSMREFVFLSQVELYRKLLSYYYYYYKSCYKYKYDQNPTLHQQLNVVTAPHLHMEFRFKPQQAHLRITALRLQPIHTLSLTPTFSR